MVEIFGGCIKLVFETFNFVFNSRQFKKIAVRINHDLTHKDPPKESPGRPQGLRLFDPSIYPGKGRFTLWKQTASTE
jgi:hypothetical protein